MGIAAMLAAPPPPLKAPLKRGGDDSCWNDFPIMRFSIAARCPPGSGIGSAGNVGMSSGFASTAWASTVGGGAATTSGDGDATAARDSATMGRADGGVTEGSD